MTTEKCKIWNTQEQEWFKPIYPGFKPGKNNTQVRITLTKEIFFSQSGEIYLYECEEGQQPVFTHIPLINDKDAVNLYIPCLYSGVRDINEIKLHVGDIASNGVATWEVVFNKGCYCGKFISKLNPGSGQQEFSNDEDSEDKTQIALRAIKGLEYKGNKFETPSLLPSA